MATRTQAAAAKTGRDLSGRRFLGRWYPLGESVARLVDRAREKSWTYE